MLTYIAFSITSFLTAFNGWLLAAIATLPLMIADLFKRIAYFSWALRAT